MLYNGKPERNFAFKEIKRIKSIRQRHSLYHADTKEKHRIISELGIKYFIDDYNTVIHHIELNCPECNAYWLNRGYGDFNLPEPENKINSLTEFFNGKF